MASFLQLPEELIIQILCCLNVSDIISCIGANRQLYTIIRASVRLQYRLALKLHGLTDNPRCRLSIADRLQLLHTREVAWSTFFWSFKNTIDVRHNPSGIYDLTGGIFMLGDAMSRQLDTKALMHVILPSEHDSALSERVVEWRRTDPKSSIIDIALAVQEHDLLAIVTTCVARSFLLYTFV